MAVRWPDGSYTGSVRVSNQAPAPGPVEPDPETIEDVTEQVKSDYKKEASHGSR